MIRTLATLILACGAFSTGVLPLVDAHASPAVDDCDDCGDGKICRTHRSHDKSEIKRLGPDLESDDMKIRIRALQEVAVLAHEHENAPSKVAADVLVAALTDHKLVVQREAFKLLTDGQHPETAVQGYVDRMKWFRGHMWTLVADMTGLRGEHGSAGEAMDVLNAFPLEMRGDPVAMSACRALLYLGTKDAVQTVIKQFDSQADDSRMRQVHFALKTFANRLDIEEAPGYGDNVAHDWKRWLRKNQRSIPKKLGKWTGPPPEDEE